MTADDIKALVTTIVADLNTAGDFTGTLDPAIIPYLQIGKAVDGLLPGLAGTVAGWIKGNPPTADEQAALLQQLAVLANPKLP